MNFVDTEVKKKEEANMIPVQKLVKLKKEWNTFLYIVLTISAVIGPLFAYVTTGSPVHAILVLLLVSFVFVGNIVIINVLVKNLIKFKVGVWFFAIIWFIILPITGILLSLGFVFTRFTMITMTLFLVIFPYCLLVIWIILMIIKSISVLFGRELIDIVSENDKRFQCKNCSTQIAGDVDACPQCGTKLFNCPVCVSLTTADDTKCRFCGSEFG